MNTILLYQHLFQSPAPSSIGGYAIIGWATAVFFFVILIWQMNLSSKAKQSLRENNIFLMNKKIRLEREIASYQHDINKAIMNVLNDEQSTQNKMHLLNHQLKERIRYLDPAFAKIDNLLDSAGVERISSAYRLSDREIQSFITSSNLCMYDAFQELKNEIPDLTEIDNALFMMKAMKLKNSDISVLLGMTDGTLRQRKFRLKNRLTSPELLDMLNMQ